MSANPRVTTVISVRIVFVFKSKTLTHFKIARITTDKMMMVTSCNAIKPIASIIGYVDSAFWVNPQPNEKQARILTVSCAFVN